MEFSDYKPSNCFCIKENDSGIKPECSILQGGSRDRDFYTALAHEINIGVPDHRGFTIIYRFDTVISKKGMLIPLLAMWDLFRILAKIEGIEDGKYAPHQC